MNSCVVLLLSLAVYCFGAAPTVQFCTEGAGTVCIFGICKTSCSGDLLTFDGTCKAVTGQWGGIVGPKVTFNAFSATFSGGGNATQFVTPLWYRNDTTCSSASSSPVTSCLYARMCNLFGGITFGDVQYMSYGYGIGEEYCEDGTTNCLKSTTPSGGNNNPVSPGVIAGATIGAVAGVTLIIVVIVLLVRRKRNYTQL